MSPKTPESNVRRAERWLCNWYFRELPSQYIEMSLTWSKNDAFDWLTPQIAANRVERIHFDSPGTPDPDHYLTPLSLFHQLPKPASDGYLFIDPQGIY